MSRPTDAPARVAARRVAWIALAALAAWSLLLVSLWRPSGGLTGHYAILRPNGDVVPFHQRIDRRINFPVPQRIESAYLFHWDSGRFGGYPTDKPAFDIRWEGLLRVPVDGAYGFAADVQGELVMTLDDRPLILQPENLTQRSLRAGLHRLTLHYRLTDGEARLVLKWKPPGGKLEIVPSANLAVDREAPGRAAGRRAAAWGVLLLGVGAIVGLMIAARREAGAARLFDLLWSERKRIALGAIILLAALLRFHDYPLVPHHHETADEYQHAWEGWHLLQERVPASWTAFPDRYPDDHKVDFRWFGDRYVVVRPYFDHPPLFSLLVGLVSTLAGAREFLACNLPVMRVVPIMLSLVGIVLLYRLALSYGVTARTALLATLVYAVMPSIILAHRLVKAESLLALLFMGAILAVRPDGEGGGRRAAMIAGVLCALSIWTKATGVAVCATVLLLLLGKRRYRDAAVVCAITLGGLALYLSYGWALDGRLFFDVLQAQATTKWVSLEAVHDLLAGKVVNQWFGRGWYLWLMLAAGVVAFRKERRLLIPVMIYGTLIAMTADHRVIFGWYRTPMLPFLCIAAGIYLNEMIRESDLFRAFPFAATAVATGLIYALPAGMADTKGAVACFALVAVAPFVPRLVVERPATARLAAGGALLLVAIFLVTSVATVGGLLEIYSAARGVR